MSYTFDSIETSMGHPNVHCAVDDHSIFHPAKRPFDLSSATNPAGGAGHLGWLTCDLSSFGKMITHQSIEFRLARR